MPVKTAVREGSRVMCVGGVVAIGRRSGFGVLEHIGQRGLAGPRIVVVTANEEERHEQIALDKGADLFLKKPFEMRELLSAVESLLKACTGTSG